MNKGMKVDVYKPGGILSKHGKNSYEDSNDGPHLRCAK